MGSDMVAIEWLTTAGGASRECPFSEALPVMGMPAGPRDSGVEPHGVGPKHQTPRRFTTRPPEPPRPEPAQRAVLSLIAVQARRGRRRPFLL